MFCRGETTLKSSFLPLDLSQVHHVDPHKLKQNSISVMDAEDLVFKGESEFRRAFQGVKVTAADAVIMKKPLSERNMLGKEDRDFKSEMQCQFVLPVDYQVCVCDFRQTNPSIVNVENLFSSMVFWRRSEPRPQ